MYHYDYHRIKCNNFATEKKSTLISSATHVASVINLHKLALIDLFQYQVNKEEEKNN